MRDSTIQSFFPGKDKVFSTLVLEKRQKCQGMKRQAAGCWREAIQSPSIEDTFSLVTTCCLAMRRDPVSANKDILSLAQSHITSAL